MRVYNLDLDFVRGWVVGNFPRSIIPNCKDFEVAVKHYKKGDVDPAHVHLVAREITIVISGKFRIGPYVFTKNDVIMMEPNEEMPDHWYVEEDGITCCIKVPSTPNDKVMLNYGTER